MPRFCSPLSTAAAIAAAALGLAAPAAAEWTREFDLSEPTSASANPSVGVDDAGRSLTAWEASLSVVRIQMRLRAADGTLGPVQTISDGKGKALQPAVAMNGAGAAAIAYKYFDGANQRLQLRVRSADGTLSPARNVSETGADVTAFEIGIDAAGNVLTAWRTVNGIRARLRDSGGTLGDTTVLAGTGGSPKANNPQVAMNPDGDAVVVFSQDSAIRERYRPAGGSFGPTRTDSVAGVIAALPDVGIDDTGRHVVTFADLPNDGANSAVEARARSASGSLGPLHTVEQVDPGFLSELRIAVDGDGLASIAYLVVGQDVANPSEVANHVMAATQPVSGAPSSPVLMSFDHYAAGPAEIAIDGAGRSFVVWPVTAQDAGNLGHVIARPLSATGVAGRRITLSELSVLHDQPAVALNGAGAGAAAWRGTNELDPFALVSGAFLPAPT